MKDNKSNISLLVFLSYTFKGLEYIILSLSKTVYYSFKYVGLGTKFLFKVNYTIIKKSIETIKNDNLHVNNEKQLSLASKKEDNVKVIPNIVESREELPWRKTKNSNKNGTRNVTPNDVLLENQFDNDIPYETNESVSFDNNNLKEEKQYNINSEINNKLPWWKRIGNNKNEEIIPIEKEYKLEENEIQPQIEETDDINQQEEYFDDKENIEPTEQHEESLEFENTKEEQAPSELTVEPMENPSIEEELNVPVVPIKDKKLPWWKRIGNKKKEEIIPIEKEYKLEENEIQPQIEEEPIELIESEVKEQESTQEKIDKINQITSDLFDNESTNEELTKENVEKNDEDITNGEIKSNELTIEPMKNPSFDEEINVPVVPIKEKKLPWWKRIGKKKKEESIIPIEDTLNQKDPEELSSINKLEDLLDDNNEIIEEKTEPTEQQEEALEFESMDQFEDTKEEAPSELTIEPMENPSIEEELNVPVVPIKEKKLPWWKRIGKKKKEELIIPIEDTLNQKDPEELSSINKLEDLLDDKQDTLDDNIEKIEIENNDEDDTSDNILNQEPISIPSIEEDSEIPIIDIDEKKLPWWKRIGKKKNEETKIPIEDTLKLEENTEINKDEKEEQKLDDAFELEPKNSPSIEEDLAIPIIDIDEKKLPWWKKIGKKKNEETKIPIEEENQEENAELEKTEDITEDNKEFNEEEAETKDDIEKVKEDNSLEFESMENPSGEEDNLDIPIIPIEEKKLPWWKKIGKNKKEEVTESNDALEFESMDQIGDWSDENENIPIDENQSPDFDFELEENASNENNIDDNVEGIFKESEEDSAREFINKREKKKEEKRKRKEEKQKEKEEKAKERAEKRRKKKLNKDAYINDKVQIEKKPFKQRIKDIGIGLSTAAVGVSDKVKNNIFSKNRRNKRDLKRKVLLIDFEGKDAEKTENKLLYEYVAKDRNGKIVKDYFNAYSKVEVHSYLLSEGYEVYSIRTNKLIQLLHAASNTNRTRFKNKDLIFFLTQLSTYLKAGIPLVDSLRIVARQYKKKNYQKIFRSIIYELSVGENFSSAMEKQNVAFPKLLINMIKTAEMTGSLPEVLDDMAEYYTEAEATRKQMITAMTYPTIVFTFSLSVMVFIMIYVVPKFVQIYDAMEDVELPGITKSILGISSFMRHYYIFLILGVIVLIFASIFAYRKVTKFRTIVQWLLMKVPVIKNTIIYNEVTMFTKTFSSLLAHNVPITDSMEILNQITNNEIYKMLILDTITNLAKGGKISDAFKDHWAFPAPAYEMIVTGEATGELAEMMSKVSSYYQELHKNSVTRIKTFIEPVLTIFLTVGVGIIILSVILPMFNMYSAVTELGE